MILEFHLKPNLIKRIIIMTGLLILADLMFTHSWQWLSPLPQGS
jgi:hypothetical protein